MNWIPKWCLGLLLWLPFSLLGQEYHTPDEVLEIMEHSKLSYQLRVTKENLVASAPLGEDNTPFMYAAGDGPQRTPSTFELDAPTATDHAAAEAFFAKADYPAARKHYQAILDRHPDFGIMATFIGQSYQEEGELAKAKDWYNKAIGINFHDFVAHWYLADVLMKEKKPAEAAQEIAIAWVLNRNIATIEQAATKIFKADGRQMKTFVFEPNYSLRKAGNSVEISYSEDWMMYAFCAALWAHEPGYHQELGGGRGEFGMVQEKECLLNLAMGYQAQYKGKPGSNVAINKLIDAINAQQINAFIFFETWLRREPMIAYTQPKEAIEALANYVLTVRAPRRKP